MTNLEAYVWRMTDEDIRRRIAQVEDRQSRADTSEAAVQDAYMLQLLYGEQAKRVKKS